MRRADPTPRSLLRRALPAVAALTLAALAGLPATAGEHTHPHTQTPSSAAPGARAVPLLDEFDWDKAQVIEVELREFSYTPSEIALERNRPYILRLHNTGSTAHDMVGGSFFSGVAIKLAQNSAGRVVTPFLKSIYVRPKQQMDLWFVPIRAGRYSFFCGLDGHREGGMEGEVVIR